MMFMWADWLLRKVTIIKPNIPTAVRYQFRAGTHNATQLSNRNVQMAHVDRAEMRFFSETGELLETRIFIYVIMVFKEPTHYGQIVVDAGNAAIPEYRVVHQGHHLAIIQFLGEIGNIALEIRTAPPNPIG